MAKQRFTEKFKQTIVDLYYVLSLIEQLASEYGMASQTFYKWTKLSTPSDYSSVTGAYLLKLEKEMTKLK